MRRLPVVQKRDRDAGFGMTELLIVLTMIAIVGSLGIGFLDLVKDLGVLALGLMVYLIYCGAPILMRTREDRALAYTATVTIAAIVTFAIQMAVAGWVPTYTPATPAAWKNCW